MAYDRDSVGKPSFFMRVLADLCMFVVNGWVLMVAVTNIHEDMPQIPAFGFSTCLSIVLAASALFNQSSFFKD